MRNCFILGSGRSGTSMAAGVLSQAGYFWGEQVYPADEGNPKGYFEDVEINRINEDLLAQVTPQRPAGILGNLLFRSRPVDWQRWLVRVPLGTVIPCPPQVEERMKAVISHEPYCLKDPRFCYTLPAWQRVIGEVVLLCVFRHPGITAHSLVKEAQRDAAFRKVPLRFDFAHALQVWELMYRHVLEQHYPQGGTWVFVHYEQFLNGSGFTKIEDQLEVQLNREFVDHRLNRSKDKRTVSPRILELYRRLCILAEYAPED